MKKIILAIFCLKNIFNNKINILKSKVMKQLFLKCEGTPSIGGNVYIRGYECISLGKDVVISNNVRIHAWEKYGEMQFKPKIDIGDNFFINNNSYISSCNSIIIGNNVLCGSNVLIADNSHGNIDLFEEEYEIPPIQRNIYSKGPIILGNNIWIGQNVVILSGITIGDNCIIAANSVVNKSFPDNVLIGGIPARIIKKLI